MLREIVGQHASNDLAFTIFGRLNVWVCIPSKQVYYTQNPNTLKIIFHYTQWRVGSSGTYMHIGCFSLLFVVARLERFTLFVMGSVHLIFRSIVIIITI